MANQKICFRAGSIRTVRAAGHRTLPRLLAGFGLDDLTRPPNRDSFPPSPLTHTTNTLSATKPRVLAAGSAWLTCENAASRHTLPPNAPHALADRRHFLGRPSRSRYFFSFPWRSLPV